MFALARGFSKVASGQASTADAAARKRLINTIKKLDSKKAQATVPADKKMIQEKMISKLHVLS
jgi:hypothetical protein